MKKILFCCLLVMVVSIGVLHYITPGHLMLFHDTFRRLSYFPIAIGAIIYGVRGGLLMAVLSCLSFVPHLLTFWYQGPETYYSELSEIIFYLAAGLVVGMISSRETLLREKYKELSEQLAASYQRLHDQAARLVQAEKELGQASKLSLLGHVSASLAHEIKNPLASIKGAAEILAEEVTPAHPKHEFVEIMRSEISRLNNSVEEVLSYCRGQRVEDADEMVPLDQVLTQVTQVGAPKIKGKGARVVLPDFRPDDAMVWVPSAALTQVLMNLILNALDEIPEKEGVIRIRLEPGEKNWSIAVEDNGPGLAPEKYDTVFKSFVTFKEGGTGLGLSISEKIVTRLGGEITAGSSREYGGACFTVKLPYMERGEVG
tara:strand:+ start:1870 stop:2985 length:1116 start_codon:yes stop_codon:yes gene_type:complete